MELKFLNEKHNIHQGDEVLIYERNYPHEVYKGIVSNILNLPVNKYINSYKNIYVDYFYIKFDIDIYNKLIQRGLSVIYKGKIEIVGDVIKNKINNKIEKIFIQYEFSNNQTEIKLEDVNSILIWRVAYDIKAGNLDSSFLQPLLYKI